MRASHAAARSYAKALFELAKERGQAEAVSRELELVVEQLARTPQLEAFLARPGVTVAAKRAAAAEVAAGLALSTLGRDFLALVVGHGRADHLGAIADAYRTSLDADAGRVRARVRTAVALTEAERAQLSARLARALHGQHVVLEEAVDPKLLGGFIAEIGSLIVDGSLDGQLARLRQRLARG
ncbi:MAG TPA: ATP synthase F1 subunit delta [Methylomirabilota bacterium]|nr:ATP synthase F1 subunit delta [Methylomirabilota bacterium]